MDEHKGAHMDLLSQLLQQHVREGNDFLLNFMTGGENWFHHSDPKTK
jgi:hypothetical protein